MEFKLGVPAIRNRPKTPAFMRVAGVIQGRLSQSSRKRIYRNETIGAQTLFIGAYLFNGLQSRPFGLYLASEAIDGNLAVSRINSFSPSRPWDIIVRNDYIYVLTNNKWYTTQNSAPNTVKVFRTPRSNFSSSASWTVISSFQTEGFARSFEEINGTLYIGIGSDLATTAKDAFTADEITYDTGMILSLKLPL